jgi:hypothetical protein
MKKKIALNECIKPSKIRIDASSICQLKCPGCPNTRGKTK